MAEEPMLRRLEIVESKQAQLEERLQCEQRGLDARLRWLERPIQPESNVTPWYKRILWREILPLWLQAVATPIMIVLVGWWLTGSLDLAIKQQQADISGVKEMREALADLYAAEPQKSKVNTAALSIAAFGGTAAGPLIEAYNLEGAARIDAARRGLIAAAARDKTRVCGVLMAVANSSAELYTQNTRTMASKLRKDLEC